MFLLPPQPDAEVIALCYNCGLPNNLLLLCGLKRITWRKSRSDASLTAFLVPSGVLRWVSGFSGALGGFRGFEICSIGSHSPFLLRKCSGFETFCRARMVFTGLCRLTPSQVEVKRKCCIFRVFQVFRGFGSFPGLFRGSVTCHASSHSWSVVRQKVPSHCVDQHDLHNHFCDLDESSVSRCSASELPLCFPGFSGFSGIFRGSIANDIGTCSSGHRNPSLLNVLF